MTGTATASGTRVFEAAWRACERRSGWVVREREVVNRPIAVSRLPFAWQDVDNRRAAAFRAEHRLDELVADAADDWEAILRLRSWAFTRLRLGAPPGVPTDDPATLVAASRGGAVTWCTFFAYTFVGAASALGLPARHLGIDHDHEAGEPSSHHGVADVWSNRWRKWVLVDPLNDCHYELDGVPLNAEELAQRWRAARGAGVRTLIGRDRRVVRQARVPAPGVPELASFSWHYIDCENDVFHRRGKRWNAPVVLLVDAERRARTWWQGGADRSYRHVRYDDGSFLMTERVADAYPDLNCTALDPQPPSDGDIVDVCRVGFGGLVPNLAHRRVTVDGGAPDAFDADEYPWRLHPGRNSLEIAAVNLAGRVGPASRVVLDIEANA